MKTARNLTLILAVIATVGAPSLFADSRHRNTTDRYRNDRSGGRLVTVEGRIRDIDRDRNGFVIRLDRGGYVLFAPVNTRVDTQRNRGNRRERVRQLERGDVIRASGRIDSRRVMYVDHVTLIREEDDRRDRNDAHLSGIVQSVDRRQGIILVEDARSRRVITVDVRRADRGTYGDDVDDLRRGDRVTIRGDWRRDGRFEAEDVDIDRRW